MSKPLELTVYPKRRVPSGFVRVNGDGTHTELATDEWLIDGSWNRFPRTEDKRLTDSELASEFHKSTADFQSSHSFYLLFEDEESEQRLDRARDWMFRMELFATHPHYDEAQS